MLPPQLLQLLDILPSSLHNYLSCTLHIMMLPRTLLSQTLKGHLRPKSLPAARALHSTARLANQKEHPFSFLPANSLEPKAARTKGLTEIRGPYYAPVTKTYLDELLSDWGEYVDGIKFAGGAFSLMPEERLRGLIDTAHKHGKLI